MGQINTNNYPTVDSLADTDLLIVENATHGTGTTTPKQLRENAIGTDPLQTTAQTVTGAINELKNSGGLPENPLSIAHGGTGNSAGYIQTGRSTQSALGTGATIEGHNNTGAGTYCHAEGHDNSCGANASYSHVEGQSNNVSGIASHAEGYGCNVSGNYSHAGGYYSTAGYQNQTAVGKYNNNKSGTLFEVGNGTSTNARNNAFEVYSDGKISCDNGASKFQFTQSGGVDGYNDASGTFHAFGGDSYALVGMGQVTSYSNKVANTNVYLHRAPKDGDRLFIHFPTEITDSDAQIKIYDEASGTAYTLSFSFWASGWKLYGLCLLGIADDGLGNLGLSLLYSFKGGTNYTAGAGIEINGSAISNTAPNYGVDVDGATISSVSSGNLGTYVGESKYLILYFSASASPYSGGYTLTLSYSGAVARYEYGTLYDGSSRYNSNISAGTMLLCEVTDTGTGSSADPVHVNIIGKIDPNSGGGSSDPYDGRKTRYTISSSNWSSSPNSDGYYTYSLTLTNPLTTSTSPNVYIAGASDSTQPTATESTMFSYVKRCNLSSSTTLVLYATTKPTSTFYVFVGAEGGGAVENLSNNIIASSLIATVTNKFCYKCGNIVQIYFRGTFVSDASGISDKQTIASGLPLPVASMGVPMITTSWADGVELIGLANINTVSATLHINGDIINKMLGKSFIVSTTYLSNT